MQVLILIKKYWVHILAVLFLLGLFLLGFFLGKERATNSDLKAAEKIYKEERKSLLTEIEQLKKERQEALDSAYFYVHKAQNQSLVTEKIVKQKNQIKHEKDKELDHIAGVTDDSLYLLFTKYAEDYIENSP